ncbi:MAG: DUF4276 family protein [Desulfobulbaceae bacterium]|nr:DUF4276 family protein [Desulfobulbaceae bacterium]
MSKKKPPKVGIIAEDDSDVDAAKVLIQRIANKDNVAIKRFVGQGCGRIKRKCHSWARNLQIKGCRYLILLHDLDRNELKELQNDLDNAISPSPITPYLICIPIEEMEAWWLADPQAIQKALNLNITPKITGHPQDITSPKEHIESLVKKYSQKTKVYLNTKHNSLIAQHLDLDKARKCGSFLPFYDFVSTHMS